VVQVIGAVPVGSTGLRSVTAQVSDGGVRPSSTVDAAAVEARGGEARRLEAETVVFPRGDGARLDARPDTLRRRRAVQRYREDGDRPGR
jgi:hypothetical protein